MAEVITKGEAGEVISALIRVQAELKPLKANDKGQHGKFANLQEVMRVLQPILDKNDLAVIQVPTGSGSGACSLQTRIIHKDKSEVSSVITIPMVRQNDPQAYGAAMTYARRYSLLCMFGMVTEDDDAASASVSLEKLLRDVCNCHSTDELSKVKEEHIQKGVFTDKFWTKVYGLVFNKQWSVVQAANE